MESPLSSSASNPLLPVKHIVWLVVGLFLLLAFFLPNYTTPIIDFSGWDLLKSAVKNPRSLQRMLEDVPTFFMVTTPFFYWFLGFLALIVAGMGLSGKKVGVDMFVMVLAGVLLFWSLVTIVVMLNRSDVPSLFSKALPKPGAVFYLTMVGEGLLLGMGILARMVGKKG